MKVGSFRVFVVLGAHVRVLTPINICRSNAKLCMNIDGAYFCRGGFSFLSNLVLKTGFVPTSTT